MRNARYHIELAVAAIVRDGLGRVALVCRQDEPQRGLWRLPGGPAEYGESLQESLRRIVRAQTGMTIDIADNRPAAVTQSILAAEDLQVVTVHYRASIHGGYDGVGYHPGGAFPNTRLVEKPYSLVMLMDTLEDMLEESKGNQSAFGRIAAS